MVLKVPRSSKDIYNNCIKKLDKQTLIYYCIDTIRLGGDRYGNFKMGSI